MWKPVLASFGKETILPFEWDWYLCWKSAGYRYIDLFMISQFCSIGLYDSPMPVPQFLVCCGSVVSLKSGVANPQSSFLKMFGYSGHFETSYTFSILFSIFASMAVKILIEILFNL